MREIRNESDIREGDKYNSLRLFVKHLREYQLADLDCVPMITSPKGMGKSSLCLQLIRCYVNFYGKKCSDTSCDYWGFTPRIKICPNCKKELRKINFDDNPKWMLKTFLAYTVKDFNDKLFSLPEYSPLMADEALRFAMGEDWNAYESKQAKRNMGQIRPRHLLVFMLIPKFRWVDRKYRDDMSTFWLRLLKRGQAVAFRPDLGEVDDAYYTKELQKLMGKYHYFSNTDKIVRRLRKHPCFWGIINYPKVPEKIYQIYLELRQEAVLSGNDTPRPEFNHKSTVQVLVYNMYYHFSEFWNKFKQQQKIKDKPTLRTMEVLFKNPLDRNSFLLHYTELSKLLKDARGILKEHDKNIPEDKETTVYKLQERQT